MTHSSAVTDGAAPYPLTLRFVPDAAGAQVIWEADVIGQRVARFSAPYDDAALSLVLAALDAAQWPDYPLDAPVFDLAAQRALAALGLWEGGRVVADVHRRVGRALFGALTADPEGAAALRTARDHARSQRRPLDYLLRFAPRAAALALLPFELLWDQHGALLMSEAGGGCVRHLDLDQAIPLPPAAAHRLHILAVSPLADIPAEARADERAARERAWAGLAERGEATVEELSPATPAALVDRMQEGAPVDVVHFFGHGRYQDGEGALLFDDGAGGATWLGAARLATLLGGVRLVVLHACRSAAHDAGLRTGVAPALSAAGAPAVVAMQLSVRAAAATRFSAVLYRSLARGASVQAAVSKARQALFVEEADGASWYVPTLTVRARDNGPLTLVAPAAPSLAVVAAPAAPRRVFVSYKRHADPDERLALALVDALQRHGHEALIDQKLPVGAEWSRALQRQIEASDYMLVLLSPASAESEMVAREVAFAHGCSQQTGRARLLPVRVAYNAALPYQLAHYLDPLQYAAWGSDADTPRLLAQLLEAVAARAPLPLLGAPAAPERDELFGARPRPAADPRFLETLRDPSGAVKLRSEFYIEREADALLARELGSPFGTTTTIRAPRQTGKSSLLIRGVAQAREGGSAVALIDLQPLEAATLASLDTLLQALAFQLLRKLRLDIAEAERAWRGPLGPADKLTYLLEDYVLPQAEGKIVLALDEADRLLDTPYQDSFFGLLRFWHNSRAISDVWERLDIVLVISTEPHLLISDVTQSPFNVGLKLRLDDFALPQVRELNERYRAPLDDREVSELLELLGGHPYLTRRALYTLVTEALPWAELRAAATGEHSPFGDHLRRALWLLRDQPALRDALRQILARGRCADEAAFYRLLQAGLIAGASSASCRARCQLYADYFKDKL